MRYAWNKLDAPRRGQSIQPTHYLSRHFSARWTFYVFYQNSVAVEAFGRSILEAIASRLVVILPHHYEAVFLALRLSMRSQRRCKRW